MSREWPLLLLEFKLISQRRCCCSLCLRSSISFFLVHNYLGLFHVHGTGYQGWLDDCFFMRSHWFFCFFSPRFDADTDLLHPSKALFPTPPSRLTTFVLHLFSAFGLTELTLHPKTGNILEANNLTILNFFLLRLGPMTEKKLVKVLICSQVSILAFYHAHACWDAS